MSPTERDGGEESLAPVIPIFGARAPHDRPASEAARAPRDGESTQTWHASWVDEAPAAGDAATARARDEAERVLVRKLRGRSLSEREARRLAADQGLEAEDVEVLIDRFLRLGYLDDARLAEQLVHTGVERKSQGRGALAQTLTQRGIPREIVQAALDDLPDDEGERALEVARAKVRSVRGLERDVAIRRLAGQLARRGYGAQALEAARRAVDEAGPSGASGGRSGVRFT
ncbi:regulatory protein RecX [Microbacterium telephonicum]|uniref:Regulatory protein RecX n=1 Tax=Microbacterium telephonicum TaxID=1714841 RepID=A0A498CC72_9MICO|nr:regulatory protein RecX [Microbacterium telephonicum]RLK53003.1 regulatory protein [Microbacterium telephonicum]